ncbi:MAG: M48 family metallopeptidase [Rhodocyclaceae bacterium]
MEKRTDSPPAGPEPAPVGDPRYANPDIPEGINVVAEHPLKEFVWLGSGVFAVAFVLVMLFGWLGHVVGAFVPFETEQRWVAGIAAHFDDAKAGADERRAGAYLQELADRLVAVDPLPDGMAITMHLSDSREINAYATLGGHVIVTRGLLAAMPSENALAMVVAHEIAHIRERHVIRSLGRGVLTSLALAVVTGSSQADIGGALVGQAGVTAGLSFSREQERDADRFALRAVHALYGHVAGAATLFEQALSEDRYAPPEWLSTHPDHARRIAALAQEAGRNRWPLEGPLTPLPDRLRQGE